MVPFDYAAGYVSIGYAVWPLAHPRILQIKKYLVLQLIVWDWLLLPALILLEHAGQWKAIYLSNCFQRTQPSWMIHFRPEMESKQRSIFRAESHSFLFSIVPHVPISTQIRFGPTMLMRRRTNLYNWSMFSSNQFGVVNRHVFATSGLVQQFAFHYFRTAYWKKVLCVVSLIRT